MNKNQDEVKSQNPKPIKKLKPLKPVSSSAKPADVKEKSEKKRIVINYDSINESPDEEPVKKKNKKSDKIIPEKKKQDKKSFFQSMKDMMYASADDDEEEPETESGDIPEEENVGGNFTVEPVQEDTTAETLENISEIISEINEEPQAEDKNTEPESEQKNEKKNTPEQVNQSEQKNNNNNNRSRKNKKKKKKSQQKNNSAENKQPEEKPAEPEKISEETVPEEKPAEEPEIQETETEVQNIPEIPEAVVSESVPVHNGKYNILALVCIILAIIGVIAIINTCISGGSSSYEKYRKAVYPAVITDISPFENPSELTDNQILSSAIWSVIIDSEKLSAYPQRVDNMAIIPAEDIENVAREIFGDDISGLTHSTIVTSDSKFYYNTEADSYSVEISPHTFTYSPEIVSVSRKSGKYIVEVNYIDQHPEWLEDTVSKTVEFTLSKNGSDGYIIEAMHEVTAE